MTKFAIYPLIAVDLTYYNESSFSLASEWFYCDHEVANVSIFAALLNTPDSPRDVIFTSNKDTPADSIIKLLVMSDIQENVSVVELMDIAQCIASDFTDDDIDDYMSMCINFDNLIFKTGLGTPSRRLDRLNTLCLDSLEGQAFSPNVKINNVLAKHGIRGIIYLAVAYDIYEGRRNDEEQHLDAPSFMSFKISVLHDIREDGNTLFFDTIYDDKGLSRSGIVVMPCYNTVYIDYDQEQRLADDCVTQEITNWSNHFNPYPIYQITDNDGFCSVELLDHDLHSSAVLNRISKDTRKIV